MGNGKKVCRITGIFQSGMATSIIEALKPMGIVDFHLAAARSIMLHEKKALFGMVSNTVLVEDPADILTFLVDFEIEDTVLNLIVEKGELHFPGRGTLFSEDVNLYKSHEICVENTASLTVSVKEPETPLQIELTGICCIVQRGEGNNIARVALDTGTCVPTITFGHGTGLRDKLGLLRIAIPSEKEVVNVFADAHDADTVMNMMIDAGKLDQPGKGFIYIYPIRKGLVNTLITRGMPKHAASMEQIIAVIDKMKENTTWRSRTSGDSLDPKKKHMFLNDLMDLTFTCNEGRGEDLVKTAMGVGAPGATISKLKHQCPEDSKYSAISRAREVCNMIIEKVQITAIVDAIGNDGAFDDKTHGQIQIRPVPKACTYLGK